MGQRTQIKARAADQNRYTSAAMNALYRLFCILRVLHDGIGFVRLPDVHQMMRNTAPVFRCGFGCADIHAPVNLHGIHANNLAAQCLRKLHAERRFAAGCRAGDTHYLRLAHWMRLKRFSNSRFEIS